MAIVTNTNLNKAPYFDDYDEDKKYIKILFRPGASIQARELTQLQTMQQKQIERFGRHMFKENSMIIPGIINTQFDYPYIKVYAYTYDTTISQTTTIPVVPAALNKMYIEEVNSQKTKLVAGQIKEFVYYTDPTTNKSCYLIYLKYTAVGDLNKRTFSPDTVLKVTNQDGEIITHLKILSTIDNVGTSSIAGLGSTAYINDGVYFCRGYFVKVTKQSLFLDYFNPRPSYRVGLRIENSIVTEKDDNSLMSNARGTSNYAAPGAHRLKLDLILHKIELEDGEDPQDTPATIDFIELLVLKDGTIWKKVTKTAYNILGDTLARRTYDESGDYTVQPFNLRVRECLNTGSNNGVKQKVLVMYTAPEMTSPHDEFEIDENCTLKQVCGTNSAAANIFSFNDRDNKIEYVQTSVNNFLTNGPFNDPTAKVEIWKNGDTSAPIAKFYIEEIIGDGKPAIIDPPAEAILPYDDQFAVILDRGKAYVKGYEIETIAPTTLIVDKARDPETDIADANDEVIVTYHGNAFYIESVIGIPKFEQFEEVNIYDDRYQVAGSTNLIGTCRAKYFLCARNVTGAGQSGEDSAAFLFSIFDVNIHPGHTIESAKSFMKGNFKANIVCNCYSYKGDVTVNVTTGEIRIAGADINIFGNVAKIGDVIVLNSGSKDGVDSSYLKVTALGASPSIATVKKWVQSTPFTGVWDSAPFTLANGDNTDSSVSIEYAEALFGRNNCLVYNAPHSNLARFNNVDQNSFLDNHFTTIKVFDNNPALETVQIQDTPFVQSTLTIETGTADKFDTSNLFYDVVVYLGGSKNKIIKPVAISANNDSTVLTITLGTQAESPPIIGGIPARVIAPVNNIEHGSAGYRGKELRVGHVDLLLASDYQKQILSLNSALDNFGNNAGIDVVRILAVWTANATPGTLPAYNPSGNDYSNFTDIKSNYVLDSGQRDNYYDFAKLTRKAGANAPTGVVRIIFEFYYHKDKSYTYYCLNSYNPSSNIPVYFSSYGKKFYLRDCLDFRPDITEFENFQTTPAIRLPASQKNFTADYQYYLGRIDRVCLDVNGKFKIVKGASSMSPIAPNIPSDAMALYNLEIPPYTLSAADVTPKFIENKRYTMRDIGQLEKRIENVEYMTLLTMLEKQTADMLIQDEEGNDCHSLGFMADPFTDDLRSESRNKNPTAKVDRLSADFRCCYDSLGSSPLMRPSFSRESINIVEDPNWAQGNIKVTTDLVGLLDYTSKMAFEQKYATATININPWNMYKFEGSIFLKPSTDNWKQTIQLDPNIVDVDTGAYDQLSDLAKELGQVWNDWSLEWTGTSTSDTGNPEDAELVDRNVIGYDYQLDDGTVLSDIYKDPQITGNGKLQRKHLLERVNKALELLGRPPITKLPHPRRAIYAKRTTSTTTTTTTGNIHQTGVEFHVIDGPPIKKSLGNKVVSVSHAQFMRNKLIEFTARKMGVKNIQVYPFFDGKYVGQYCSTQTEGGPADKKNPHIRIKKGTDIQKLITDDTGTCHGWFDLPCEQDNPKTGKKGTRFEVGEKMFTLSSDKSVTSSIPRVSAKAPYSAEGLIETTQETIMSIRNPIIVATETEMDTPVTTKDTDTDTSTIVKRGNWVDPVCQTFAIYGSDPGIFVTSIDVYFKTKSTNSPVSLQIFETGSDERPGQKQLPFAYVELDADEVSTVDYTLTTRTIKKSTVESQAAVTDGATRFTFSTPIYLLNDTAYAFVVKSADSDEYNIWIMQMQKSEGSDPDASSGEQSETEKLRQTLVWPEELRGESATIRPDVAHAMWTSANGANWEGDQRLQVKFKINKAQFEFGGHVDARDDGFNGDDSATTREYIMELGSDPIQINRQNNEPTEQQIYIRHKNHGFKTGNVVQLFGLTDIYNGTSDANLIEGATVTVQSSVDTDGYFALPLVPAGSWNYKKNLSFSGRCGGDTVYASFQKKIDVLNINATYFTPPGTSVNISGNIRRYASPLGTKHTFKKITVKENIYFDEPMIILAPPNNGNVPSLNLLLGMSTSNVNVSPVFDIGSWGAVAVSNRINNPVPPTQQSTDINYYNMVDATFDPPVEVYGNDKSINLPILTTPGFTKEDYDQKFSIGKYIRWFQNNGSPVQIIPLMITKKTTTTIDQQNYYKLSLAGAVNAAQLTGKVKIQQHDYYVDEIAPVNGGCAAKWPSLRVTLKEPATKLFVKFGACRDKTSIVDFYYKIKTTSDTREMDDIQYIKAVTDVEMTPSIIEDEFKWYEYTIKDLLPFEIFVCKIVMRQNLGNSTNVPQIKAFQVHAYA